MSGRVILLVRNMAAMRLMTMPSTVMAAITVCVCLCMAQSLSFDMPTSMEPIMPPFASRIGSNMEMKVVSGMLSSMNADLPDEISLSASMGRFVPVSCLPAPSVRFVAMRVPLYVMVVNMPGSL